MKWSAIGMTVLLLWSPVQSSAQRDASRHEYRPDVGHVSHSCGEAQSLYIRFQERDGGLTFQDAAGFEDLLRRWRQDRGTILVTPWVPRDEQERVGFAIRDRRVAFFAERLRGAGVSAIHIFVRETSEDGTPGFPEHGTVLMVQLARGGETCLSERRDQRLRWIERNCLGPQAREPQAICVQALRETP